MTTQPIPNTTDDLIAEIEAAMANATPGYWYQSKGIGVVVDHNDCGVVCETCEGEGVVPCDNCEEIDDHECHIDGVVYGPYPCPDCPTNH